MLKDRVWRVVFPALLAIASMTLLIRVNSGNVLGIDLLLLLLGLSLGTLISLSVILRQLIRRFAEQSAYFVRRQAIEEHQRFLKRLDHELKNPLTAIRAGLASLSLVITEEKAKHTINLLESEAARLSRLIANLRKLAESESMPLEFYPIDIARLVDEIRTIHQLQRTTDERQFSINVPDQRVFVGLTMQGDEDLLLLAMHNVLENAVKYTDKNATITLSISIEETYLVIKITDSGIGINAQEIDFVWGELYRSEAVSHIPGSGIGLALVHNIMEQHEGDVFIDSVLNQGTTVTLILPLESVPISKLS